MAHREAGLVVGRQLCDRGGCGQRRGERERGEQNSFHGILVLLTTFTIAPARCDVAPQTLKPGCSGVSLCPRSVTACEPATFRPDGGRIGAATFATVTQVSEVRTELLLRRFHEQSDRTTITIGRQEEGDDRFEQAHHMVS